MLSISLNDGDFVENESSDSFVRLVYGVLAKNWDYYPSLQGALDRTQVRLIVSYYLLSLLNLE